jgi:serine kinase of HPr protein (carbohydrate metabolism regulator)
LNLHGTALVLADRGLLIFGPAQGGKSSLALHLIDRCRQAGRFAALVADDQVLVRAAGSRLLCLRPEPIAGLMEIVPLGPVAVESVPAAVIDLAIGLVPSSDIGRIEEPGRFEAAGVTVPRLNVAVHNTLHSAAAVLAALRFLRPA